MTLALAMCLISPHFISSRFILQLDVATDAKIQLSYGRRETGSSETSHTKTRSVIYEIPIADWFDTRAGRHLWERQHRSVAHVPRGQTLNAATSLDSKGGISFKVATPSLLLLSVAWILSWHLDPRILKRIRTPDQLTRRTETIQASGYESAACFVRGDGVRPTKKARAQLRARYTWEAGEGRGSRSVR